MLLHIQAHSFACQQPVDRWRYPGEADFTGGWLEFRDEIPEPYHVRADFNGDGLEDDAWILIRNDGDGWGLFVFMSRLNDVPDVIKLINGLDELYYNLGISITPPGRYITACGKGHWDCGQDEPEEITLKRPGINFFMYEGANSFYYWDDNIGKFKAVAISD